MLFFAPKTIGDAALLSLIGFIFILILKTLLFLITSDFKTIRAVLFTIAAVFISTLIGLLVTVMFTSPDYLLVGIVTIFLISLFPASRVRKFERYQKYTKFTVTFIFTMITLITIVLFAHSIGYQAPSQISMAVKIIFSTLAIVLSLILSIIYEESIISGLYRSSTKESKTFVKPVIWINIISILMVVIVAAIWILTAKEVTAEIKISELFSILISR